MSLINKMLQDLESRQGAPASAVPRKAVYEDLHSVKDSKWPTPHRRLAMMLVTVMVVAVSGVVVWKQWSQSLLAKHDTASVPKAPVVVARKAPPKPIAPAPVVSKPDEISQEPPKNIDAKTVGESPPSGQDVPKGDAAMAPPPAIVQPEPPAPVAHPASDYWTVAEGETLYRIATQNGVDQRDLAEWNHLGPDYHISPGQKLRLSPPELIAAKPPEQAIKATAKKPPLAVPPTSEKSAPSVVRVDGEASADAGTMDKKIKPLTSEEQAEGHYRQAANLLQQGRAGDAEQYLRSALAAYAGHVKARELLVGLTLQNGRWREAQQTLEQGLVKLPRHYPFAQLLARVYVEHEAEPKALTVMEHSRPDGSASPEFMSFLATLYQRAGRHAEAVKSYAEAVKMNPQEGRWWLGMGISLEAGQDWQMATESYRRAIESGSLDDKLLPYAKQRLSIVKNK